MCTSRWCLALASVLVASMGAVASAKPPVPVRAQPTLPAATVAEAPALLAFREIGAEEGRYRRRVARIDRLREVAGKDQALLADVEELSARMNRIRAAQLRAVREKVGDETFFAALAQHQEVRQRAAERRRGAGDDDATDDDDAGAVDEKDARAGRERDGRRGRDAADAGDDAAGQRGRRGPRAYPGSKWIVLCHIPPGNPGQRKSIRVSENALEAHLAHGDLLGACDGDDIGDAEMHEDETPPSGGAAKDRGGRPDRAGSKPKGEGGGAGGADSDEGDDETDDDKGGRGRAGGGGKPDAGGRGKGRPDEDDRGGRGGGKKP